jgi:CheY-like chemotaxis protein
MVDDEEIVLDAGSLMLETLGYRVLRAGGGQEALEIYEKNRGGIDMVILDMIMPEMGGGQTYDLLKEADPGLRILLSTGYSLDGQAQEILDRGCNGFIQKPFRMADLSKKLQEILNKGDAH